MSDKVNLLHQTKQKFLDKRGNSYLVLKIFLKAIINNYNVQLVNQILFLSQEFFH
jgi:hypothetical protein